MDIGNWRNNEKPLFSKSPNTTKNDKTVAEICKEIRSTIDNITTGLAELEVQNRNWQWYQENDPRALEFMASLNSQKFKELYIAEFGTNPPESSKNLDFDGLNAEREEDRKLGRNWSFYYNEAPEELEYLAIRNPVAFAQMYKEEFGSLPEGFKQI